MVDLFKIWVQNKSQCNACDCDEEQAAPRTSFMGMVQGLSGIQYPHPCSVFYFILPAQSLLPYLDYYPVNPISRNKKN